MAFILMSPPTDKIQYENCHTAYSSGQYASALTTWMWLRDFIDADPTNGQEQRSDATSCSKTWSYRFFFGDCFPLAPNLG